MAFRMGFLVLVSLLVLLIQMIEGHVRPIVSKNQALRVMADDYIYLIQGHYRYIKNAIGKAYYAYV